jgi:Xaa-Pro aminopeptidase
MLTEVDKKRLNDYHREVYEKLSPYFNEEEKAWLKDVTKEV